MSTNQFNQSDGFDFTFDCPIYLLMDPTTGGFQIHPLGALMLWTDMDAALWFLENSIASWPSMESLSLFKIESDGRLLDLLTAAQKDGIQEIAVDASCADQRTVRMLYTVDIIDMLQERIAEAA